MSAERTLLGIEAVTKRFGAVTDIVGAAERVERLAAEYEAARRRLAL